MTTGEVPQLKPLPQRKKKKGKGPYLLLIAIMITGGYAGYSNSEVVTNTLEEFINEFFHSTPAVVSSDKQITFTCDTWQEQRLAPTPQLSDIQTLDMEIPYRVVIERLDSKVNFQIKDQYETDHYRCEANAVNAGTQQPTSIDMRCNIWSGSRVLTKKKEPSELRPREIHANFKAYDQFRIVLDRDRYSREVKWQIAGRGNTYFACRILGH